MLFHENVLHVNALIAQLPPLERSSVLAQCKLVELYRGDVLAEAGEASATVYFPVDCVVSLMLQATQAPSVAIALVGGEGMFSSPQILEVGAAAFTGVVQGAGRAWHMERHALQDQLRSQVCLRDVLYRYAAVCLNQASLQVVCMRYHTVAQRVSRWLLMMRDRSETSELFLTHAMLASMLGATRASVTRAASDLQNHGVISYGRGYVTVLDVLALQGMSCDCYQTDRHIYRSGMAGRPEACKVSAGPAEQM